MWHRHSCLCSGRSRPAPRICNLESWRDPAQTRVSVPHRSCSSALLRTPTPETSRPRYPATAINGAPRADSRGAPSYTLLLLRIRFGDFAKEIDDLVVARIDVVRLDARLGSQGWGQKALCGR